MAKVRNISFSLVDVVRSTTAVLQMSAGCELWKGCARWLKDLGLIGTSNDSMVEFASILRDGVLLCRLANVLIPNSIDQNDVIRTKQQSQFSCLKNINTFLDACRDKFNMKEEELFNAGDLFFMNGFHNCLLTMSLLSKSKASLARNIEPFPENVSISEEGVSGTGQLNHAEEDIYQSLTDNIENVDPDQTIYGPVTSTDPTEEEHNEKLYDHIVMARKSSMNEIDTSPGMKRARCIKELYDTEKNYVENALHKIMTKFYDPLKGIIPHEQHKVVFGNVEKIMSVHKLLLDDLHYPVSIALGLDNVQRPTSLDGSVKFIGDVFIKHREGLLEYGFYCSNLNKSRDRIATLMEDEFIRKNIIECTKFDNNQFSMQDLLTVPFQRITKYSLLIREMLKHTDVTSPDRHSLMDAEECLTDICLHVNEVAKDYDMHRLINKIEKNIVDLSMPLNVRLTDYGRLNYDGDVKMSESTVTQPGKPKQRFVFLFDKVLIICKQSKGNTFNYKNAFVISELTADLNVSIDTRASGTITRRVQWVVHLHRDRTETSEIVHLAFYFKNEIARTKWLKEFLKSKENVAPVDLLKDTGHKVTYFNIKPETKLGVSCGVCKKLLKGIFYQGYRCDLCHNYLHKECLGLLKCDARRSSEPRNSQSFNMNRPRQIFSAGEIVVATSNFNPSDISYLQFKKDDRIEILQIHSNSRFTGCLVNNRLRTGLVSIDKVTRARTTSMVGLSPADSPAGSIFSRLDRKDSTMLPRKQESFLSDGTQFSLQQPSSTRPQEYVNTEIKEYSWYMGDMERQKAETTLRNTPNGTFLVRFSSNRNKTAISLSYKGEYKHMIIEQNRDNKFYLDEGYIFNSIVELVSYYRDHNLIEIFQGLDTTLKSPYLQTKVYIAIHDYKAPDPAPEGKFLSLTTGDTVVLLDTVGEDRGWWKGQANNMSGFFPLTYVQPLAEWEQIQQQIKENGSGISSHS